VLLRICVENRTGEIAVDARRVRAAVKASLRLGGIEDGEVSVVVVDDLAIHELNRRHLGHDYPTDVLSFEIEREDVRIEGDIVVSADTALRMAARFGWSAADELLLYVVHGALHLAGFDDVAPGRRTAMRAAEKIVLARFGLVPRYDDRE
jgi:probable rRNA maturation factor